MRQWANTATHDVMYFIIYCDQNKTETLQIFFTSVCPIMGYAWYTKNNSINNLFVTPIFRYIYLNPWDY